MFESIRFKLSICSLFLFLQTDVKKPRSTKCIHTVLLQESGSTVTKTVQLTLKQSVGPNARIANRLAETISSQSPTPPGSPVVKVSAFVYAPHPCKSRNHIYHGIKCSLALTLTNRPFYSCGSVTRPMNGSEAAGDLVLIQSSLLFLCKYRLVSITTTRFT